MEALRSEDGLPQGPKPHTGTDHEDKQLSKVYSTLLRFFLNRVGKSEKDISFEAGIDRSYLVRIEQNDRNPPSAHISEALARALQLTRFEQRLLLVAGGHVTAEMQQKGWDSTTDQVFEIINDPESSEENVAEYRFVIDQINKHWHSKFSR